MDVVTAKQMRARASPGESGLNKDLGQALGEAGHRHGGEEQAGRLQGAAQGGATAGLHRKSEWKNTAGGWWLGLWPWEDPAHQRRHGRAWELQQSPGWQERTVRDDGGAWSQKGLRAVTLLHRPGDGNRT